MKRYLIASALALVAFAAAPFGLDGALAQDAGEGQLTITHAATADYPTQTNAIGLCVDGSGPEILEVGDQFAVSQSTAAPVTIDLYDNDADSCLLPPDRSIEVTLIDGTPQGLLIALDALTVFAYDEACVPEGEARVLVAQGATSAVDAYAFSPATGDTVQIATAVGGGEVGAPAVIEADTYDIEVYPQGAGTDGPPLAVLEGVELADASSTQVFLAGEGEAQAGGFTFQQPMVPCAAEEPPPEETTSTSTTSTTAPAVVPGAAAPATPVRGTSTYTG